MMNGVGIMDETHLKALNQTLVSFENIHHKYGKITSVEDISFQIQHGEIVSLLGPSGCGKTTMLRLAAGFETPSAGHITKNSIQISSPDEMLLPEHRNMGLVFQSYALFPHMTVEQNV
ncbi:MAG: ATP-binding cassette domain-containing protein, partial [Candidatus Puniceispirillaceae bacterium]